MLIEDRILDVANKVFQVDPSDIRVDSRFKGGMSNYTYLVYVKDAPYVIRIIGDGGEHLVTPAIEKKHIQIVAPLNLNSELVYFDKKTGVKVSKYVPGIPLSESMSDADYQSVANALKKLHQAKLPGEDYGLKKRLRSYEKLLKTPPSFQYYALKMAWLKLYDSFYIHLPKVLCHGDAQRSNLVNSGEQIYLLDWEFSGLNDPMYDIASFGNIDFKDAEKLLGIYLDRIPTLSELTHIRFYRMYQVLQWHIVATYKHEINLSEKLHLDFSKIADKYLKLAAHFLEQIKGV